MKDGVVRWSIPRRCIFFLWHFASITHSLMTCKDSTRDCWQRLPTFLVRNMLFLSGCFQSFLCLWVLNLFFFVTSLGKVFFIVVNYSWRFFRSSTWTFMSSPRFVMFSANIYLNKLLFRLSFFPPEYVATLDCTPQLPPFLLLPLSSSLTRWTSILRLISAIDTF